MTAMMQLPWGVVRQRPLPSNGALNIQQLTYGRLQAERVNQF